MRIKFVLFLMVSLAALLHGCNTKNADEQSLLGAQMPISAMDEEHFWSIMSYVAAISDGEDIDSQEEALEAQLVDLTDDELVGFARTYERIHNDAYMWDLWEAAFFTSGGCSDDGFTCFRNWVIGRGKEAYFRILDNPDNLADYPMGDDPAMSAQCAEWDLLPGQVWENRDTNRDDNQWFDLWYESPSMNKKPIGEIFDEEDLDGFKSKFPRLADQYSHIWE
jgi:hypothetical protein